MVCGQDMNLEVVLERTVTGLGYELVDTERIGRGVLRIYIDHVDGITVDDCAKVSNQLTRLFAVENIDYERLEVSSPGLDRPLRKPADFERYVGETARLKLRVPRAGKRNFVGVLHGVDAAGIRLDVDGDQMTFALDEIDKARLVPKF